MLRGKRCGLVHPSPADALLSARLDAVGEVSVGWGPSHNHRQPRAPVHARPSTEAKRAGLRARPLGVLLFSGLLAETTSSARLETRTKESNVRASERVSNPSQAQGNRQCVNFLWKCNTGRRRGPRLSVGAQQHARWDPKDGELCLSRAKPEETLVEARRCADVQIAFQTWV